MKYSNKICKFDGIKFDSKLELRRYLSLKDQEKHGLIKNISTTEKYILKGINGGKICTYAPDFVYEKANGDLVVEDTKCKSTTTYSFRMKQKLMKDNYGIDVKVVYKEKAHLYIDEI